MVRTRGLTHVALAVDDVDRSLQFYRDVFGVVEIYRSPGFVQAQTPGSFDVLVFQARSGEPGALTSSSTAHIRSSR